MISFLIKSLFISLVAIPLSFGMTIRVIDKVATDLEKEEEEVENIN